MFGIFCCCKNKNVLKGPNVLNPVPNPTGSSSQKVCKDLIPKVIKLGQANGTAQFQWTGNLLGHNPDVSDNFTLYLATYLLGKGASSTLTAHVTGGYDASILDESGFTNNSGLLTVDYGEPLELAYCVGGSGTEGGGGGGGGEEEEGGEGSGTSFKI